MRQKNVLPVDLVKHICTFHNPHKTNYERVIRELILKNLDEQQLLLVKMTRASRLEPYFFVRRDEEFKQVWLANIQQYYDGSWATLVIKEAEFMELFDVKVCYSFWKNCGGYFWDLEELREGFDYEYYHYLDHAMCAMESDSETERDPEEAEADTDMEEEETVRELETSLEVNVE